MLCVLRCPPPQALEAKEGVTIKPEAQATASITFQVGG
jgi:preprotein translocase subunit SecA